MIPLLTTQQMRDCDKGAIQKMGVPSLLLMERAGMGVAQLANELLAGLVLGDDEYVLVLCGPGNNGGDGLVVARYLALSGRPVKVALFAGEDKLAPDSSHNLRMARNYSIDITFVETQAKCRAMLGGAALVVDALFGTGGKPGLSGLYAYLAKTLAERAIRVIAVDVPSGFSLEAEVGSGEGEAILADFTVTLGFPKVAQVSPRAYEYSGELFWQELSYPPKAVAEQNPSTFLIEGNDISSLLPPRELCAHKGDYGKVLIVAGSPGMVGAAVMVAQGALRCGSGLVKVALPAPLEAQARALLMEAMTIPLADDEGCFHPLAYKQLSEYLEWADVVAVGPGLGKSEGAKAILQHLLNRRLPLVIDADGLNLLADLGDYRLPPGSVLTPHPGEMARLTGRSVETLEASRRDSAAAFAGKVRAVVVLKGFGSVIANPQGEAFVNPTGGPALAKGGSGDVLTGAIASFVGQGYPAREAALLGAFLHGLAGYMVGRELGEYSGMAGDVLDFLPNAIKIMQNQEFYNWELPLAGWGPQPVYGRAMLDFLLDGELSYELYLPGGFAESR
jgi:hydroxyethylthiazole kinase-like uncharacterized protein yjeF